MPVILDRVPLDLVETFWPHVLPHLTAACDAVTTSETPEQYKADILADRAGLWVILDTDSPFPFLAAAVACTRETNRGPVAVIRAAAGRDGHRWIKQTIREFEAHAKASGAVAVEIEGRPGWARTLPGYRTARIVLEKEL